MKTLLVVFLTAFVFVNARAEEAVPAGIPAASSSAKKKAQAKKKASKKPVEKTVIAAPVPAAEQKPSMNKNLQEWLAKMKKRVASSKAKQNKLVAVAAVRGDEKSDPPPLYWKGKEGEKPVNPAEIEEFNTAVETAINGDSTAAKTKLEQFVSTYPKSPLVADANETIAKLSVTEPEPAEPIAQ